MKSAENTGLHLNSKLLYLLTVLFGFLNFFELLVMPCCRKHINYIYECSLKRTVKN